MISNNTLTLVHSPGEEETVVARQIGSGSSGGFEEGHADEVAYTATLAEELAWSQLLLSIGPLVGEIEWLMTKRAPNAHIGRRGLLNKMC